MSTMDDDELGRLVGEVSIRYSVRELLARIEERQVRTDEKISQLATAAEVESLRTMVDRQEARWNRVIGAAIAVSALVGGAAGWISQLLATR